MWSALNMRVKKPAPRQLAQGRENRKQTSTMTLFPMMALTPSLQRLVFRKHSTWYPKRWQTLLHLWQF